MIDLGYYQIVIDTQYDPEILKVELQDLVNEVREELNRYKQALTRAVSLPKGELPHGQGYYTWINSGNCVVEKEEL